jgi:ribosomal protein L13E
MHHVKPRILKPNGKQRSGRGFSPEELKKAGLNPTEAARLCLPTDLRRKTAHDENVEVVKAYVEKKKAEAILETKKKPKS